MLLENTNIECLENMDVKIALDTSKPIVLRL